MTATANNSGPAYAKHPEYSISIEPTNNQKTIHLGGRLIAQSSDALVFYETNYPPVIYFPPKDVELEQARISDHSTYCPFKGQASYWSFGDAENVAWFYETPYDEVISIKNYIAFYKDRVDPA